MDGATRNDPGLRRHDGDRRQGRVVVGVDGSLASLGALRRAVAEARRLDRQLCAVRVVPYEDLGIMPKPLGREDVAALHEQLKVAYEEALVGCRGTSRPAAWSGWAFPVGRWSATPAVRMTCWWWVPAVRAAGAGGGRGSGR